MINLRLIPLCAAVAMLFASCVSQKEYNALLSSKARADRENIRLAQVERDCEETNRQLTQTLSSLNNTEGALQDYKSDLENMTTSRSTLQTEYDELLDDYNDFQESTAVEKNELLALMTMKQDELDDKERIVRSLEATLYANTDQLRSKDQRIRELNTKIARDQERLDSLKNAISQALVGIAAEDLAVEQRNGKVYVSLSQNLLFAKNSKELEPAGVEALSKLGGVLAESPGVDIIVEGHTDTDGAEQYNWDLSTSRATAVVSQLLKNGVSGQQLTASGRAFYDPIAPGEDEEAKAKNRRTEIILAPRINEALEFLSQK